MISIVRKQRHDINIDVLGNVFVVIAAQFICERIRVKEIALSLQCGPVTVNDILKMTRKYGQRRFCGERKMSVSECTTLPEKVLWRRDTAQQIAEP